MTPLSYEDALTRLRNARNLQPGVGTMSVATGIVDAILDEPVRTASERNTAGCCDGLGQVHHGEGALSYVTLCKDPACQQRRQDEWDAA